MRRLAPVLGVALLIALLVFVNRGISHTAPPDVDDDAPAKSSSQASAKPAAPASDAMIMDEIPPEITVGDPAKAKHKILVGWIYDETSQPTPQALAATLHMIELNSQSSGGTVFAEIVDLDVPQAELSPLAGTVTDLGVVIDGAPIGQAVSPGSTGLSVDEVARALPKKGV